MHIIKPFGIVLLILALIAIFLAMTNPSPDDHHAVIEGRLFPALRQAVVSAEKARERQGVFGGFKASLSRAMVRMVVEETIRKARAGLTYRNYLLFSTVTLDGKTWTVGVLGRVHLMVDAEN